MINNIRSKLETRSNDNAFLLMDADWVAGARELERKDDVFRAIVQELKRRCDEMLDRNNPRFFDVDDLDSFWWRTRIGTKQLIVATWDLAMASVYFGAERYGRLAATMLLNLAENNMAEKARGTCYSYVFKSWMQASLDTGHASEGLGMSFDLLQPYFSGEQAQAVGNYLRKFITAEEKFIETEGGEQRLNFQNMPMIGRFGLGVLALALEKAGLLDAQKYVAWSRFAALEYLEHGGHAEGLLPEGPMYGCACLKHIAVLGTLLERRGDAAIWESSAWDRIIEAYASQIIPGEGLPNPWNDCYPPRITSWLLDAARHRRNGLARWLWETMVRPLGDARWDAPVPCNDIRAPWWNALLPHALVSYDPSVPPCSPGQRGLPLRRHFVNRGIYDDRTGWAEEDWYLTLTCLPDARWRNRRGWLHNQADRGHFSLAALGEQFAIDSGYGNEVLTGSTEVIRFGATGEAHNVPEIGGEMQQRSVMAQGFREVLTDGWARLARMEFAECYSNCARASRTVIVVPDTRGVPLYVAIYDCILPRLATSLTYGLVLHTDACNTVRLIDRETAEVVGGRKGHRCRVIMTALRPGRLALDSFLGHPRLRYQNQGAALYALTILAPCLREEPAPVFERNATDNEAGFGARLRFRGVEDVIMLCAEDALTAWDYTTDAGCAIVRPAAAPKLAVIEGTYINRDSRPIFASEQRGTLIQG